MRTLPLKELKLQVRQKGFEISRGEKPKVLSASPEFKNEKLVKSIIGAIDDMKLQSKSLSENLVTATKSIAELGKPEVEVGKESTIITKRKWNMDVIRDGEGLIKKIVAEEI